MHGISSPSPIPRFTLLPVTLQNPTLPNSLEKEAYKWVKQSWDAVSAYTIVNCFKHCGVQPRTDEVTDSFADLDEKSEDEQEGDSGSQDEELQELVQQFEPEPNASDYINADEDLPTCATYVNNENWRD